MHSKEYMVAEFVIMFKYAATNLIFTFMLIFYSGEADLLVVCIYRCVNSSIYFYKNITS